MKKIITLLLLILIMTGLTGCSNVSLGYIGNESSHKMSASYLSYSGTKENTITVKDGESVEVSVDIETKKGTIDAYIYKDKNNYEYEGQDIPTSSFTVTLTEPGDYKLKVEAHKHKGGFTFQW